MHSAVMRVRHALAYATHSFFNERGFVYVHTPLITGADCEGAGEQFTVTTLLDEDGKIAKDKLDPKTGAADFSKDFFGRRSHMTVSGQLNVETHACALCDCYTFGPTFRAEDSHTTRHLAEFWMIEPEICFASLSDDMDLMEDYLKHCVAYALEACAEDLGEFFGKVVEKGLVGRLENIVERTFVRLTYTEAVDTLLEHIKTGKVAFPEDKPVFWGVDLASEHERYLAEKVHGGPIMVYDYPKDIKAFYMLLNPDGKTCAACDVLVPKIGEVIGGSAREDRLDVLTQRAKDVGVEPESLWWYNDLRKYGSVPHAGFGLGFERLVMLVTGIENIRDVIPFPRYPGHSDF